MGRAQFLGERQMRWDRLVGAKFVCGLTSAPRRLGHSLPYLIPDVRTLERTFALVRRFDQVRFSTAAQDFGPGAVA